MVEPRAFISYSHDSEDHKDWVLKLASHLRDKGIDVTLDRWDLGLGQDVAAFMNAGITESDRVLLVCTSQYVEKAEAGSGGVGYERLIVTGELVRNIETKKFIPLVRANPEKSVPTFLGPRLYIDFSDDLEYAERLQELVGELHGMPSASKPPLGPSPFSGVALSPTSGNRAGPSGLTLLGSRLLDDDWFEEQASQARIGLKSVDLTGGMELRFGLHEPVGKSQIELLNGVREAQIKTFGWPIGIVLDKDEYRPRSVANGIRADVPIKERSFSGESSFDYWATRTNGDFYLLQSLFEDQRGEGQIFFNTRIVRVTEALLFCARLYRQLGVGEETRLSIRVTHVGLANRELTSSSPNRFISPGTTIEDTSQTEFVESVEGLGRELATHVKRVAAPMFMLFDFKEFATEIYEDIVSKFVQGHVS